MTFDSPKNDHIHELRLLFKEAFGDSDEFLDIFYGKAFSHDRCRCATENGKIIAALYWFDCSYDGLKAAYLYAVATSETHRGKGVGKALLDDTHTFLASHGYALALLVPGSESLFNYYARAGYSVCCYVGETVCNASSDRIDIRRTDSDEYAVLRRKLLDERSVIQEGASLEFLSELAELYAGDGFVLACSKNGEAINGIELLGDASLAPSILNSLGLAYGRFRIPNGTKPFAMYYPLNENVTAPAYLGLAFD